ncbi:hypothetical protein [Bacillus pseudomycoides]|uniref:hypothetical protein n=1 Tax=Bacillus pseudomycoides TaxID=64104 RepID=UPI0015CF709F|nr:hypothetical protein [Bacillus pseudomycoides]
MSNRRYMVRNGRYIWKSADIFEGMIDIVLLIMMVMRMYVLFEAFCSTIEDR